MVGGFKKTQRENEAIKDRVTRDIRNLFEHEEEGNYDKPGRESNFWSNNYVEYESKVDINKALSTEEYLNKIRPNLKDIINDLQNLIHGKSN